MIYPIIDFKTVGAPLILIERNLAIHPDIGAVSDGIVFLVRVGNTNFMVDQRGRFYYEANGEAKKDWYHPERLEYLGSDRVSYGYSGKIESIGGCSIRYDFRGERPEYISDTLIQYEYSSSRAGLIEHVGPIYFYYNEYNYSKSRPEASKIGECSFYYKAGGDLDKITYYGDKIGDVKSPSTNAYLRNNTVYIYYEYGGRVSRIGDTDIR